MLIFIDKIETALILKSTAECNDLSEGRIRLGLKISIFLIQQ